MRRKCMWAEWCACGWREEKAEMKVKVLPAWLTWACSLHVFCLSPPQQHGQAPNQALLQPQHLCAGQTVSGAAQVADVPSHERGSGNARQEAQCARERQLCKLRRDVWQHLTAPRHPSAPLLPYISSSTPSPSLPPVFSLSLFGLASACWFYLLG